MDIIQLLFLGVGGNLKVHSAAWRKHGCHLCFGPRKVVGHHYCRRLEAHVRRRAQHYIVGNLRKQCCKGKGVSEWSGGWGIGLFFKKKKNVSYTSTAWKCWETIDDDFIININYYGCWRTRNNYNNIHNPNPNSRRVQLFFFFPKSFSQPELVSVGAPLHPASVFKWSKSVFLAVPQQQSLVLKSTTQWLFFFCLAAQPSHFLHFP